MRHLIILALLLAPLSGCLANESSRAVRTIGEIQKSEYRAQYHSAKSADAVSRCMMQTLDGYRTDQGTQPYAGVELLKAGPNQEMTLIMPSRPVAGKSRPEAELLFLIENLRVETEGTRSRIWVNPTIHSPAPQVSLNMLSNIVKACLWGCAAPAGVQRPSSSSGWCRPMGNRWFPGACPTLTFLLR